MEVQRLQKKKKECCDENRGKEFTFSESYRDMGMTRLRLLNGVISRTFQFDDAIYNHLYLPSRW